MYSIPWLLLLAVIVVYVGAWLFVHRRLEKRPLSSSIPRSAFKKKEYLFDSVSEFHFFHTLQELVGEKYYIFPQVGYSHLITETSNQPLVRRKYRSMIDRKSADYVLCDKTKMIPCLAIELNGNWHSLPERIQRDNLIQMITKNVGLPIVAIDVRDIDDKALVLDKINQALKV